MADFNTAKVVSADLAQRLVAAAAKKADEIGKPMCIAVCDNAGVEKAFMRMDGSPQLSIGISQNKSSTAIGFGIPTDQWYDFIKDDGPLAMGIVHTPKLVIFGGGYPIKVDGEVIGGIGVSGGHWTDDMEVAVAALEACGVPHTD